MVRLVPSADTNGYVPAGWLHPAKLDAEPICLVGSGGPGILNGSLQRWNPGQIVGVWETQRAHPREILHLQAQSSAHAPESQAVHL